MMIPTRPTVTITLRIPCDWRHPKELLDRIPDGYRIKADRLILPDQTEIELSPIPPDNQFPSIFRSTLRRPANAEELAIVDRYTVNVALSGPGGSLESARKMMQAGAAIIQAGGAGVFIDNSGLAHGAEAWLYMTEEASSDAVSFAFVSIFRGNREVWTTGMHVAGFPEIIMKRADADADDRAIIEMIRYVCADEFPIGDGHIIADEVGPRFRIEHEFPEVSGVPDAMHNPFGRFRMTSMKDIAELN